MASHCPAVRQHEDALLIGPHAETNHATVPHLPPLYLAAASSRRRFTSPRHARGAKDLLQEADRRSYSTTSHANVRSLGLHSLSPSASRRTKSPRERGGLARLSDRAC